MYACMAMCLDMHVRVATAYTFRTGTVEIFSCVLSLHVSFTYSQKIASPPYVSCFADLHLSSGQLIPADRYRLIRRAESRFGHPMVPCICTLLPVSKSMFFDRPLAARRCLAAFVLVNKSTMMVHALMFVRSQRCSPIVCGFASVRNEFSYSLFDG